MSPIAVFLLACGVAVGAPADAAAQAVKELQGTWTLVAMEEKGQRISVEEVKAEGCSFVIRGSEFLLKERGKTKMRFSFKVDPTKSPRHIDFQRRDGPTVPGTCHAIYSLEKGQLKICIGTNFNPDEPEERPQEFATKLRSEGRPPKGKNLFILKRNRE
jgi:uncharacterized protein (TIGR03067 family)